MAKDNQDYADMICSDMINRLQTHEPARKKMIVDAVVDGDGELRMADTPDAICKWIEAYGQRIPEDHKVWIETEKITVTIKEYVERQNRK